MRLNPLSSFTLSSFNYGLPMHRAGTVLLSALLALFVARSAVADDMAEVSRLERAGQFAEAMAKADAALAQRPNDPRMRFAKAMILARQNKSTEAVALLAKLTQDFPELPEPYNNLAVLYAAEGQYENARIALEKATSRNPNYVTAYENLGDVYAELATQAYEKVIKLDAGNAGVRTKMAALRNVTVNGLSAGAQKSPAALAKEPAKATTTATAALKPRDATGPSTPAETNPAVAATSKSVPASALPESASDGSDQRDQILAVVKAWAAAWSAKDVKSYLDFYSSDFEPTGGKSRAAWKDERSARISEKQRIDVKVESPKVRVNGDTATVKFRQMFASERLTVANFKTLVLVKRDGNWQIRQERTSE